MPERTVREQGGWDSLDMIRRGYGKPAFPDDNANSAWLIEAWREAQQQHRGSA